MMKSGSLFATAILGGLFAVMAVAGDAGAQMRTRKFEYYEGIQRKPYGHYWILPPVEQREPAYSQRPGKDGSAGNTTRSRKRPTQ
ncbi:hypothetical protein PWG15_14365 [Ensifer adhaerens]|uniref:hypothetical protein n=1 Tax=Ensifer adhaerens TaxID=106592 RepID=UPI0023A9B09B|nr:hypothetical protein [Ensifer adhaerens]WDZ75791.1 hypothetical protein PWG15_14365 [Ensifer adhaerens]